MRAILIVIGVLACIYVVDAIISRRLHNPYTVIGYFGLPGSGKSTYLAAEAIKHARRGWTVYTNDTSVQGDNIRHYDAEAYKRGEWLPDGRAGRPEWYGQKYDASAKRYVDVCSDVINETDRDICLCIDEIGILYNNREFKQNFTAETLAWWKKHRHARIKVIYNSQSYKDTDLKIRQLTAKYYIVKRAILRSWVTARPIFVMFDIRNSDTESNSGGQIVEAYSYDIFLLNKHIFLPYWVRKFDSYQ